VVAAAFIVVSHHDNIQRLLQGRERKLGETVSPT
jgi:glycerol-3-phosphate acyltransferase PlsY